MICSRPFNFPIVLHVAVSIHSVFCSILFDEKIEASFYSARHRAAGASSFTAVQVVVSMSSRCFDNRGSLWFCTLSPVRLVRRSLVACQKDHVSPFRRKGFYSLLPIAYVVLGACVHNFFTHLGHPCFVQSKRRKMLLSPKVATLERASQKVKVKVAARRCFEAAFAQHHR